jgi:hypothetical protein
MNFRSPVFTASLASPNGADGNESETLHDEFHEIKKGIGVLATREAYELKET